MRLNTKLVLENLITFNCRSIFELYQGGGFFKVFRASELESVWNRVFKNMFKTKLEITKFIPFCDTLALTHFCRKFLLFVRFLWYASVDALLSQISTFCPILETNWRWKKKRKWLFWKNIFICWIDCLRKMNVVRTLVLLIFFWFFFSKSL